MIDIEKYRAAFEALVGASGRADLLARTNGSTGWYEDLTVAGWWTGWCWAIDHIHEESLKQSQWEVIAWINEDELPTNYPYDAMYPHSKVDFVRLFPVFAPKIG